MSALCNWLHVQLERLPIIKFPFRLEELPEDGIYFFYEQGELWGHGGNKPRIIRIGTAKDGNFRNRIKEHFLLDESKMNFDATKPAPRERSIFRKHIGKALLENQRDNYLEIWNRDFTSSDSRIKFGYLRDIKKEKRIESAVSIILREKFSFRFIIVDGQVQRMGSKGLESSLIGTLSHCKFCKPSSNWLGIHSPTKQIKESGLWLVQHLKANEIDESDKTTILKAIKKTKSWFSD